MFSQWRKVALKKAGFVLVVPDAFETLNEWESLGAKFAGNLARLRKNAYVIERGIVES